MKVVLLCGGRGTRWTRKHDDVPKALAMVGDRPLIWHVMTVYSASGFDEFILCLGHKGGQVRDYFMSHQAPGQDQNSDFVVVQPAPGIVWRVHLLDTGEDVQTATRLKASLQLVGRERFLASYGDGLASIDINDLVRFHQQHGRLATLTAVQPRSQFGILRLGGEGNVLDFIEKPEMVDWVNGGFFVFEPEIVDYLDEGPLEVGPLGRLSRDRQLMAYRTRAFWTCLDTFKDLITLDDLWRKGNPPWNTWRSATSRPTAGAAAPSLSPARTGL